MSRFNLNFSPAPFLVADPFVISSRSEPCKAFELFPVCLFLCVFVSACACEPTGNWNKVGCEPKIVLERRGQGILISWFTGGRFSTMDVNGKVDHCGWRKQKSITWTDYAANGLQHKLRRQAMKTILVQCQIHWEEMPWTSSQNCWQPTCLSCNPSL